MTDCTKSTINSGSAAASPQCEYSVVRKKRLCRMTVRPGRRYCGEHEPQPRPGPAQGQDDSRIPCPYDPKHTCYASRLEKHLSVCNARAGAAPAPDYIQHNVNAPPAPTPAPTAAPPPARRPLAQLSKETIMQVIRKVNTLYEKYIDGNICTLSEAAIHSAVASEFGERGRAEGSRRHLRQASALLLAAERERLVRPDTCYVELGAGKGQLSYYMCTAWCAAGTGTGSGSRVLVVDRAPLRHKRDNKLRGERCTRLRADLAHVALRSVPAARDAAALVGLAKHLCGVATDYALRCLTAEGVAARTRGAVLATCCHHRCELAPYFGNTHLRELGITDEDFNVMLGIVSWATCGDGRSRDRRRRDDNGDSPGADNESVYGSKDQNSEKTFSSKDENSENTPSAKDQNSENTFGAKDQNSENTSGAKDQNSENTSGAKDQNSENTSGAKDQTSEIELKSSASDEHSEVKPSDSGGERSEKGEGDVQYAMLSRESRAEVGRRAKALVDWGRVLALRARGLRARLVRYVPAHVSPENLCIIATNPQHQL